MADNIIDIETIRAMRRGLDINTLRAYVDSTFVGHDTTQIPMLENAACDDCVHDGHPSQHERVWRHGSINLCRAHLEPRLRVSSALKAADG